MKNLMFLTSLFGLMIISANDVSAQKYNVALNKPTTQSSLYAASYPASKAVDGITTGKAGDFTHTKEEANPWWQVDLGDVYDVNEIVIWNRSDCCWERLQNYFVMMSGSPITSNSTTNVVSKGSFQQNQPNAVENFGSKGKKGRYIRIFTQNGTMPLSLAEVQVFVENNIIGNWGNNSGTELLTFTPGEYKRYVNGSLVCDYSYRILDNQSVELTDKDGKKSFATAHLFSQNGALTWSHGADHGNYGAYHRVKAKPNQK